MYLVFGIEEYCIQMSDRQKGEKIVGVLLFNYTKYPLTEIGFASPAVLLVV